MATSRPIVALTAGDVAGIGPEIVVRALQDSRVRTVCQPLVICHPEILRRVLDQCEDKSLSIVCLDAVPSDREILCDQLAEDENTLVCLNPADDDVLKAPVCAVSAEAGPGGVCVSGSSHRNGKNRDCRRDFHRPAQ